MDALKQVQELRDEIERLKCCGNCKNYNEKYGYDCCNLDDECSRYSPTSGDDRWQPLPDAPGVKGGE